MDTQQFLTSVLGSGAHYCLFGSRGDGKKVQRFYTSVEDLVRNAKALDSKGADAYYGVARFASGESRKAANVEALAALFLDLDCGSGKDFTDKRAALQALRKFCDAVELPKPVVIDSGGGLHVYWLLDEPAPREQWVRVAELLKKVCNAKRFKADPAVTSDAARILRVPGTHNHKYDTPIEVRFLMGSTRKHSLEHIGGRLLGALDKIGSRQEAGGLPFPAPVLPVGESSDAALQNLLGSRRASFRQILERTRKGRGCAQLAHIIKSRAEASEPLWRAGLSIAAHCTDSKKAIHVISKGHPGYDPDDAEGKAQHIKGPYLCERFDELNPGGCEGCPNLGKVKSPIVLGQYIEEAEEGAEPEFAVGEPQKAPSSTPTGGVPPMPKPYFRAKTGGIYIRTKNEDGEQEESLVYRHDLYVIRRVVDPEVGESLVFRVHFPKDGSKDFTLPLSAVSSKDELRKSMTPQGVMVLNWEILLRYVMAWLDELQASVSADIAHRQFGWTDDDCTSFILGEKEIFADRIDMNPPSSTTAGMMHAFKERGTLDGWKKNMEFYNQEGMELHQLVQLASFGSVLMHSSPVNCAAMHIYSKDSGFGKTTAFESALAAWGDPDELMLRKKDTVNAKMNRADVYHNLPLMLDEVTNADGHDLSELAYQFTSGRQKDRMTSGANQNRARGRGWKLLAIMNGNTSFIEKVATAKDLPKAEAQRVLEVEVHKFFDSTKAKALTDAFSEEVKRHYGFAGPMFVQHYMRNRERIDDLLARTRTKIDEKAELTSQNRFWSEFASKSMVAAFVLKEMGLIQWDMRRLFEFIVGMLNANKTNTLTMDTPAMDIVVDYFNDNYGNFLQIRSNEDLTGGSNGGMERLLVPDFEPRMKIFGRYESDTRRLFIVPRQLKDWCGRRQVPYNSTLRELESVNGARKTRVRLGKGTRIHLPPQQVIVLQIPEDKAEDFEAHGDDQP